MPGDFKGARIHTVRGVRDGSIGPMAALIFLENICENWKIGATYREMPPG